MRKLKTEDFDQRLVVDGADSPDSVCDMLRRNQPPLEEFDYALYTDGGGDKFGFGSSVAIAQPLLELPSGWDTLLTYASGNFGSNVYRNEFSALLDGLVTILNYEAKRQVAMGTVIPELDMREAKASDFPNAFRNSRRIRVCWYTDSQSLALGFVKTKEGGLLQARQSEQDLWARWLHLRQYFALWPIHNSRNTVPGQAMADYVCTYTRRGIKKALKEAETKAESFWLNKPPRKF